MVYDQRSSGHKRRASSIFILYPKFQLCFWIVRRQKLILITKQYGDHGVEVSRRSYLRKGHSPHKSICWIMDPFAVQTSPPAPFPLQWCRHAMRTAVPKVQPRSKRVDEQTWSWCEYEHISGLSKRSYLRATTGLPKSQWWNEDLFPLYATSPFLWLQEPAAEPSSPRRYSARSIHSLGTIRNTN